jgi:MOSC domain-containing protein YiiM
MDPVHEARARQDQGLDGNANQGGKRQVTVIAQEAIDAASAELDRKVPPSARRANLMVRGLDLKDSRGRILRIGELRLLIHGETRPCERMDEAIPGLRQALDPDWRGGVYGAVLADGTIRLGDPAEWE